MVRERQLMNDRIAILFPQNRQVFGFAQGLTEAGMEVEVPKQRSGNNTLPTHDFNSSRPKLMAVNESPPVDSWKKWPPDEISISRPVTFTVHQCQTSCSPNQHFGPMSVIRTFNPSLV